MQLKQGNNSWTDRKSGQQAKQLSCKCIPKEKQKVDLYLWTKVKGEQKADVSQMHLLHVSVGFIYLLGLLKTC